jgi:hypothetical protein
MHDGPRTDITVLNEEFLPESRLAFHSDLVDCHPSPVLGRVAFMVLHIESNALGSWEVPVIYAAVENTAMADMMLKHKARVSHIIQMRFGHGLGGGRIPPGFLTRLVEPLRTEAFITDRQFELGRTMTVPHFESLNTHAPVDLNSWTVARRRYTVPWSGYEPAKFFMRP